MQRSRSALVIPVSAALLLGSLLMSCSHVGIRSSRIPEAWPPASRTPANTPTTPYVQYGTASWYGEAFHGRRTANGEVFDMFKLSAAHQAAPLGMQALVTNLDTGRSVRVRINDRGPFVGDRILDLSYAAAYQLGMLEAGLAAVKIQFLPETIPLPTFIVQAGAYHDEVNARRVQKTLSAFYPDVWIAPANEGLHLFYRVQLGTFRSRERAAAAADRILSLGYAAQVIPLSEPLSPLRRSEDRL